MARSQRVQLQVCITWVFGVWLHQKSDVGMHVNSTRQRAVLARAIQLLPPLERHGTQLFLALRGTPWLMRTGKHEEEVEDREHSNHQRDRSSQRARAMHNEGFHPRRNTRRDHRRNYLRFKDHTAEYVELGTKDDEEAEGSQKSSDYFLMSSRPNALLRMCSSAVDRLSRNLAVALQGKSRGDMYAVNMLEEFCKQLALERPSCRRIWHAAIDVVNAIGEKLTHLVPRDPTNGKGSLGEVEMPTAHSVIDGAVRHSSCFLTRERRTVRQHSSEISNDTTKDKCYPWEKQ